VDALLEISNAGNSTETLFISGLAALGMLSLGLGFTRSKIGLIVLRALTGMGVYHNPSGALPHFNLCALAASITVPSALNLIVHLFPDQHQQARAIGFFGSCSALGNGKRMLYSI
jgi:hypothetical protein